MQLKIMHGKRITVRYLIMEFVRHYAVWDVRNTCMSSSSSSFSFFPFDMGFFLMCSIFVLLFLIFLFWCHVLGASWKKMRSSQWHNYWVILLLIVHLALGILNF